jgi:predicted Fe-Mo cluster-binding NifX family protein
MKICFPVAENKDMNSIVYNHFGSAPEFVIVNTDTNRVLTVGNKDQHHAHGACNPIMALNGEEVDAIVVGGIGAGALSKLNQKGIRVFQARETTISENIELLKNGSLLQFAPHHTCSGHGHGGGCSH